MTTVAYKRPVQWVCYIILAYETTNTLNVNILSNGIITSRQKLTNAFQLVAALQWHIMYRVEGRYVIGDVWYVIAVTVGM